MDHFDFFKHDLNLLVAFDALVAERNVSRAAARVGVTQSAMSHSLARLRRTFGDELFLRSPGGVAPTAVAEQLAPRIARALQEIHGVLVHGTHFDASTARRVFRIGLSDAQQALLLPALLQRLSESAPQVTVQALAFDRQRVLDQLARGELDLAVSRFDVVQAPYIAVDLFLEKHLCLWNPALVALRPPLSLDDYLALPHVLFSHGGDLTGVVDQQLARLGRRRRVVATTPHAHTVALVVQSTASIAVLPGHIAEQCARLYGLKLAPPPVPLEPYLLRALWHARAEGDGGNAWLRERLQDVVRAADGVVTGQQQERRSVSRGRSAKR